MTVSDLTRFVRARKGTVLSVTLHVLVLGWGLFSFSARSMVEIGRASCRERV